MCYFYYANSKKTPLKHQRLNLFLESCYPICIDGHTLTLKMHLLFKSFTKSLMAIFLLCGLLGCGQKGPLIIEQLPEQQQEEPVEETK